MRARHEPLAIENIEGYCSCTGRSAIVLTNIPASDNNHQGSDNNHGEEDERLEGRKRRRLSLSADRCENQGAE
jgi:hypothetical protein